jgi:hypothetical protein
MWSTHPRVSRPGRREDDVGVGRQGGFDEAVIVGASDELDGLGGGVAAEAFESYRPVPGYQDRVPAGWSVTLGVFRAQRSGSRSKLTDASLIVTGTPLPEISRICSSTASLGEP